MEFPTTVYRDGLYEVCFGLEQYRELRADGWKDEKPEGEVQSLSAAAYQAGLQIVIASKLNAPKRRGRPPNSEREVA